MLTANIFSTTSKAFLVESMVPILKFVKNHILLMLNEATEEGKINCYS
jgi:hypothetical protein